MSPWRFRRAGNLLRRGGVVAYPTEGVFGLGCDPLDAGAVARICRIKGRRLERGVIVVAACPDQLEWFLGPVPAAVRARVEATWPGPTTWLLPAGSHTPAWLTGAHDTLAVRVSAHSVVCGLCNAFGGAIVSTSANRGGAPPATSTVLVYKQLGNEVDAIIAGRVVPGLGPSEIRDGLSNCVVRSARKTATSQALRTEIV